MQQLTGSTGVEARRLVRVGTLVATLSSLDLDEGLVPWLSGAGLGVAAGTLSVEAFDTIRVGLGEPTEDVSTDDLAGAALVKNRVAGIFEYRRRALEQRFGARQQPLGEQHSSASPHAVLGLV